MVTGAGGAIGSEIARAFAKEGASVAIVDWKEAAAKKVADEIVATGHKAIAIQADVGDEGSIDGAFKAIRAAIGDVDILVNNAAIESSSRLEVMPVNMWDEMIRVNLRSVFLCTRLVLPAMKRKGWGRVINTTSNLAYKGGVDLVHYSAAKAGILGFTRALAWEVSQFGITVNAVAPGPTETPMLFSLSQEWLDNKKKELPIGRFGRVSEIVPAFLMLASDDGAFCVGSCINVTGGDVMP